MVKEIHSFQQGSSPSSGVEALRKSDSGSVCIGSQQRDSLGQAHPAHP
jgi:hypothetical protein